MNTILYLFGEGKDLNMLQMSLRAVLVFLIGLVLVRLSGRRSFGMRMPFDNVVTIILGAVLSRAVIGASPFWPTIAASAVIVAMHRLFAWLSLYSDAFGCLIKGESLSLYKEGKINQQLMKDTLMTEKDLIEGIRINSNLDTLEDVKEVFVERDGQVSVVKKSGK